MGFRLAACAGLLVLSGAIGCSDRPKVRTQPLPFEPEARLMVDGLSLAGSNPIKDLRSEDGAIVTGRPFFLDVEYVAPASSDAEITLVTFYAVSPASEQREVASNSLARRAKFPWRSTHVVPALQTAGQWKLLVSEQHGPGWENLSHPSTIAQFSIEVEPAEPLP
jgi:hypothetical protein